MTVDNAPWQEHVLLVLVCMLEVNCCFVLPNILPCANVHMLVEVILDLHFGRL